MKRDKIEAEGRLVEMLTRNGYEAGQVRTYVANNRHNHITAHYYLLKKKAEREPAVLTPGSPPKPSKPIANSSPSPPRFPKKTSKDEPTPDSPLVHRP